MKIFYVLLGAVSFETGLRRVYNDEEVRLMIEVGSEARSLNCYVVKEGNLGSLFTETLDCRKKLSPRKKKGVVEKSVVLGNKSTHQRPNVGPSINGAKNPTHNTNPS